MRLAYAALLSAAVAARTVAARPAHLVADLAPEAIRGAIEPFAPAVATGDDLYFEAVDPTYFGQLWRTNGSPGDLKRVTSVEGGGIRAFAAVDGVVYYFGFEPPGITLRKITPLAEDAEAVASFADADGLAIVGDTLVFAANDGVHGWEPWQSDGTPGGTSILADLVPGGGNSDPFGFTRADGTFAFFFAATDAGQAALWRTDGTAAGTRRVAGFGTAPAEGFRPSVLGVVGGELVFTTYQGNGRFRLWSSDGTGTGTAAIAEFSGDYVGISSPFPYIGPYSNGTTAGGFLYFTANDAIHGDEPWRTNGTSGGTALVADIYPGPPGSYGGGFAAIGDSVVFGALDPVHGTEPWIATAGVPGARLIRDVRPGPIGTVYGFLAAGNVVYFTADDGVSGSEPWRTDGTENGTFRVADIAPGPPGSRPGFLFVKGGDIFFTADSGEGQELWKTDGSESGTLVVEDLARPASSYPAPLADVSGRLFASTITGTNGDAAYRSLWVTSGLFENTLPVRDFEAIGPSGFAPLSFLSIGDRLLFAADDGVHGDEPWLSDGTEAGTTLLADLVTSEGNALHIPDSNPFAFTPFHGETAFVAAADPSALPQLWRTDASAAGTRLIADLSPKRVFNGSPLLSFGSALFFVATDGSGTELWRSDGTAAGTAVVKPLGPLGTYRIVVAGNAFYFASGNTLWRSDGTTAGTQPVFSSEDSIDPYQIETANGLVFFLVTRESSALWRTDGTEAGTFAVSDSALEPTAAGSFVLFSHDDGVHGAELWRTDGTIAGTVLVRDIRPGSIGSHPGDFAAAGGSVYFSANDGVHGIEPWRSDGTARGTSLVADVLPGIGSSRPSRFLRAGDQIYFAADDGIHGVELWAAPLGPDGSRRVIVPTSPRAPLPVRRPSP